MAAVAPSPRDEQASRACDELDYLQPQWAIQAAFVNDISEPQAERARVRPYLAANVARQDQLSDTVFDITMADYIPDGEEEYLPPPRPQESFYHLPRARDDATMQQTRAYLIGPNVASVSPVNATTIKTEARLVQQHELARHCRALTSSWEEIEGNEMEAQRFETLHYLFGNDTRLLRFVTGDHTSMTATTYACRPRPDLQHAIQIFTCQATRTIQLHPAATFWSWFGSTATRPRAEIEGVQAHFRSSGGRASLGHLLVSDMVDYLNSNTGVQIIHD